MLSWRQLQQVYWAGWSGILFKGPLTRTFSRVTQVVPVDPEHGLTSTLLFARAILDRGNVLTWFPEGERARDGKTHRFLPGAGLLIQKNSCAGGAGVHHRHLRGVAGHPAAAAHPPDPSSLRTARNACRQRARDRRHGGA